MADVRGQMVWTPSEAMHVAEAAVAFAGPCSCEGQCYKERAEELCKFQCNRRGEVCCPGRTFPQHGQTVTDTALGHRAASLSSYPWT